MRGRVALARIERPAVRNALDPATLAALAGLLTEPGDVRAVVLTGAGAESFCAGMDLKALAAAGDHVTASIAAFDEAFDAPDRIPIVAALNGPATGGGMELALRCDLVVAAEHAHLHLPEVRRGIVPGGGATQLPALVPLAIAVELALVGTPMPARRAYELGLVNRVVPAGEVLDVAVALASTIAGNAPVAVRTTRRLLWHTVRHGVEAGAEATAAALQEDAVRLEMAEGVAAFVEKRDPCW